MFKNLDSVPKDIKAHFRYPEELFNMQSNVLGKYHVTDSDVFYNGEYHMGNIQLIKRSWRRKTA